MAECLVAESGRVRDGVAAGWPGAKVFRAHRSPQEWHRTLDRPLHPRRPRRKVLRSLTRADLGAIRRICFRTHVCVLLTVGLPDASRQGARPDAGDGWSGGIVLASGQNRPERNPAERPGSDVLARRANRDAGRNAAVRPHGRMRDGPQGRSRLRLGVPSRGGRKAKEDMWRTSGIKPLVCYSARMSPRSASSRSIVGSPRVTKPPSTAPRSIDRIASA